MHKKFGGKKKLYRVPGHGTRQRGSLPSAKNKTLGKEVFWIFFRNFLFGECLHCGTRQRYFKIKCNFFNSSLCRVPKLLGTRQRHFKKNIESLPSAVSGALGKVFSKKKAPASSFILCCFLSFSFPEEDSIQHFCVCQKCAVEVLYLKNKIVLWKFNF